jgi:ABC-type sugar transport system ATPase subunit
MNAPGDGNVLVTKGLTKEFQGFVAVKNANLSIREGAVHGLIGPNGAGKTTVFNLLTKFLQPTAGTITYRRSDVTRFFASDVARLGLVRSFQISAVFSNMSVLDSMRVAMQRQNGLATQFWKSRKVLHALDHRALALIDEVGLSAHAETVAGTLAYMTREELPEAVDFQVTHATEIHYWRKHPNLHGWMEKLYFEKGGSAEVFDCVAVVLTREDLDRLEADVKARRLPHTTGFSSESRMARNAMMTSPLLPKLARLSQPG